MMQRSPCFDDGAALVGFDGSPWTSMMADGLEVGFNGSPCFDAGEVGDAVAGCFTVCQVCDDSGKAAPCARPLADVAKSVITP